MAKKLGSLTILFLFVVLNACGSDDEKDSTGKNICAKACDKLEECPSTQCTLNTDNCDAAAQKLAECVLEKPCDQVLTCV